MDKFDWASLDYRQFEKLYYEYVKIDKPLFIVIDDIVMTMETSGQLFFVAPAPVCKDNRKHTFYFEIREDDLYHFIGMSK